MNTFSASGMLGRHLKINRARVKITPLTLAYAVLLSSGTAMLYLTVVMSHYA